MNQTATAAQPDVAQLREANLPAAVFPGGRNPAYRIYYTPDLHARLWQHANESLAVEICGVLLGVWGRDEAGPFVNVTESIRGEAATSKFAEVTFTHETWAKINHEMDTRFSHLSIVGWYHTHPDFGIFLSDRDVFIQQHFFANPGNIAYVIDPVRKTEGTFTWQGGKPVLAPHYWIGDKIQLAGAPTCLAGAAGPAVPGGPSSKAQPAASSDRPVADHLAPLVRPLTQVLAYLALFLLGFLLAGRLADWDRLRTEQDAVARVALLLGVKPGLREALERSRTELAGLSKDVDVLAKAHQKAAGEEMTETQQEQWCAVRSGLADSRARIAELEAIYCLTPAETQRLIEFAASLAGNNPNLSPGQRARLAANLEKLLQQLVKQGLVPEDTPKETKEPPKDKPAPPNKEGKATEKK